MDTQKIIAELKNETRRLDQAIAALEGMKSQLSSLKVKSLLAPRKTAGAKLAPATGSTRDSISEQKRKRMSEAMKKSWAARRKKA